MEFEDVMQLTVQFVEGIGVAILVIGIVAALVIATIRSVRGTARPSVYRDTRLMVGRVLLLGIEVLVAGDIIRTVAIELTLTGVAELAGIVAIRTFLSWSIELETEGRWPWRSHPVDPTVTPQDEVTTASHQPPRSATREAD